MTAGGTSGVPKPLELWLWLVAISALIGACREEDRAPHVGGLDPGSDRRDASAFAPPDAANEPADEPMSALAAMTLVPANEVVGTGAFLIDPYEAVIVNGEARAIEGRVPEVNVTFAEAVAACERAEKRICSEEEWRAACFGPDNLYVSFQETHDSPRLVTEVCDVSRTTNNTPGSLPSPAGSHPDCKTSGLDVWDMIGNLGEWVDSDAPRGPFPAGISFYMPPEQSSCDAGLGERDGSAIPLTERDTDIGFRCCADAP